MVDILGFDLTDFVVNTARSSFESTNFRILMTYKNMNLKEALEYAQGCRHQVQPNYSFMKELIKYEHSLLGSNSLKMTELTKMNAHYSRAYAVDKQDHRSCTTM